ncbi:outer membrane beta-barrel family protein [Xanthocytophaga agilis]|uniref:Outer membrane beta-barrel family protein n=1 Tax=Xanthocytophaga agilis TaxID=3048010 RepID=A0AAE3R6G3_9BACT|nr:outer membrane beta-barrel family protein [Xanthocytophaga agilis]MDJ1504746.1 outer membrane beta-barrel family protein [Xanthocytophaga agilis]
MIILLLLLGTGFVPLLAQEGAIAGAVANEAGEMQPAITITLRKMPDSSSVKSTLTTVDGRFEFLHIQEGSYVLQASGVGFQRYTEPVSVSSKTASYVHIQLKTEVVGLREISVTAQKQAVERQIDRTVIHVDAILSNAGTNAWEMLEQSSGVQVVNDNLSVKGKQNVSVFVDNKPLYLQGNDLANYLKSLPANTLDKIEIIPNPPAGYEAAGNGGIINIRLKKNDRMGFNGNILSENIRGKRSRISQSLNANFRIQKINVYGNVSNYNGTGLSVSTSERIYQANEANSLASATQNMSVSNPNHRVFGKLGVDFYASPKTTWGISASHLYRDMLEKTTLINTQVYNRNNGYTLVKADNRANTLTNNTNVTLSFRHVYDTTGRELTADADYITYRQGYNFSNSSAAYGYNPKLETFTGDLPYSIAIYALKIDYTHPFRNGSKLGVGYKSSFTHVNSLATYTGDNPQLSDLSNRFTYQETIHALYLSYSLTYRRLSLLSGVRIENTLSSGKQQSVTSSSFERSYQNVFPTVYVSYTLDSQKEHLLHFSYGRRIDRPEYSILNPFAMPLDNYTYKQGNPFLKPQISQNLEFSYVYKNRLTLSSFYTRSRDIAQETILVKENMFYRQPANLGQQEIIGFSADGTWNLTQWWTVNPVITYTSLRSVLDTDKLQVKGSNWSAAAVSQFSFRKGWTAEVITEYMAPQLYMQYIQGASWYTHMGVGKKIWKDKGIVKVNIRDLFYSRVDRQDLHNLTGVIGYSNRKWDTRSVTLAVSYRFGKSLKASNSPKTETPDEKKRLGNQ